MMMREPAHIARLWRKDLWEAFYDPFFFQTTLNNLDIYVALTRVALQTEPERFVEITGTFQQHSFLLPSITLFE